MNYEDKTFHIIFLLTCCIAAGLGIGVNKNGTKNTDEDNVDDRINLNFNHGQAVAQGLDGFSKSDAYSQGVQIGFRRPGDIDRPIYQDSNAYSHTNAYGRRPPNTWAYGQNAMGPGYNRGGAGAGFNNALNGYTNSQSYNERVEVPIDPYGTVLFSGLVDKSQNKNGQQKTKH